MTKDSGEIKVSGLNAVLALAEHRIDDVIRVYLLEDRIRDLGPLLAFCAKAKKAYHVVEAEELDRVAESVHHEGVCVLAKRKHALSFAALIKNLERNRGPAALVLLEDVKNPHNVGAILRTAAHFGARALLLPDEQLALRPSGALLRTAEGGAESVELVHVRDMKSAIEALAEVGFRAVATSSHARESVYSWHPPERTLVMLGSEGRGLSKGAIALSDSMVAIPGTGAVESLNVASAAAIILGEIFRAHSTRRGKSRH